MGSTEKLTPPSFMDAQIYERQKQFPNAPYYPSYICAPHQGLADQIEKKLDVRKLVSLLLLYLLIIIASI